MDIDKLYELEKQRLEASIPIESAKIDRHFANLGLLGSNFHQMAIINLHNQKENILSQYRQRLLEAQEQYKEREKERAEIRKLAKRQQLYDLGALMATILATPIPKAGNKEEYTTPFAIAGEWVKGKGIPGARKWIKEKGIPPIVGAGKWVKEKGTPPLANVWEWVKKLRQERSKKDLPSTNVMPILDKFAKKNTMTLQQRGKNIPLPLISDYLWGSKKKLFGEQRLLPKGFTLTPKL